MNPIVFDSSIESYIQGLGSFNAIPSAIAVISNDLNLLYSNDAFNQFNNRSRSSVGEITSKSSLLSCIEINKWLVSINNTHDKKEISCFLSRNINFTINLIVTPIIDGNDIVHAKLITIGEESLNFDTYHLARLQENNNKLKNRIIKLNNDKKQNDHLIKVLLKNSPFSLLIMNKDQVIINTNKKAEELFKTPSNKMIGRHCSSIIHCYQCANSCKALVDSKKIEAEEVILNPICNDIEILRSVETLKNHDDNIIIEAFVDVTASRVAEREIKELGEINTLLVNSTGEGILSVDIDLNCTFINKAGLDIIKYKNTDIKKLDISKIFLTNSEEKKTIDHVEIIKDSMSLNKSKNEEATLINGNMEEIPIQYLCNPIHDDNKVTGAVLVFRNIAESKVIAKKMDYLATHDALTGLLNRYAFELRLKELITHKKVDYNGNILCFIDLDQFKAVNDTAGHAAGDELLQQLSRLIHESIKTSDVLCRLGGDEFGLLLINCSLHKAIKIIETILQEIIDYRFSWGGSIFTVGASIGVVELTDRFTSVSSSMNAADSACYIAKEHGRQRIHVYEENDGDIQQHKMELTWINRIKNSLNNNQFELWQQPICDINDIENRQHVEILIRLRDENNNIVPPGNFIPTAERYNLMSDIDRWVLKETLSYLIDSPPKKGDIISINLSGQSISDELFIEFIENLFTEHMRLTSFVCFEVTETAAISNLSKASDFMRHIKNLGFTFALDDFGSGMSSFGYLKNLPIDYLKIDGNFIRNIENDHIDLAMVKAIHNVGSVIGIKTIAEFVENQEIINILKEIGIDFVQGYAISKPYPIHKNS